jgi:hypothetical protein
MTSDCGSGTLLSGEGNNEPASPFWNEPWKNEFRRRYG